jgi:hypothetical protein
VSAAGEVEDAESHFGEKVRAEEEPFEPAAAAGVEEDDAGDLGLGGRVALRQVDAGLHFVADESEATCPRFAG